MGNIFKKKLHLGLLARLKVLILLAFVIVVGCLVVFVRSFNEFVFGWPLLHPQPYEHIPMVLIIMLWFLMLYYVDKGEVEEGRAIMPKRVLLLALLLPLLGLWLISPIAAQTEGTPEKIDTVLGTEYNLTHYAAPKGGKTYLIRGISIEEYELITRSYVKRKAFGWMIFHTVLTVYLLYCHHKVSSDDLSPIKALDPSEMNIQQAILTLRAAPHDAQMWLRLGWMLAREGEAEYARDCYQRHLTELREALSLNLSDSPTASDVLPSWLNSSPITQHASVSWPENDSTSLPSWFSKYKSGVSLFLLLRTLYMSPFVWLVLLPVILFFPLPLVVSYPEGGQSFTILLAPLRVLFSAMMALLIIRLLAGVLHFAIVYVNCRSWPTSEAMVIGSFIRKWKHRNKEYYKLYFAVVYKAGGEIFYSTVPSINAYDPLIDDEAIEKFASSQAARKLQDERYCFGKRIPIFYNPSLPDVVLNEIGFNPGHIITVVGMIMMALLLRVFSAMLWYK